MAAAAGTNAAAGDFTLSSTTTLTIAAGSTVSAGTVTVTATDDATPAPDKLVTVSATVSGGNGVAAPEAVTLTIADDDGVADPVVLTADAGDDQSVDEGDGVTLDGSGSSAPSGQPGVELSYAWTQTAGRPAVTLTGAGTATPTFTAPQVSAITELTFELTVTAGGASASDTVTITVKDRSPGVTDLAPSFGDATIPEQFWTQNTAIAAFTLPAATGGDGTLTYTLSPALPVGVSRDTTPPRLRHAFRAHGADAVHLDGHRQRRRHRHTQLPRHGCGGCPGRRRRRRPEGGRGGRGRPGRQWSSAPSGQPGVELSYAWTQTAGRPAVTLTGAGTATPTFTAPQVSATTELTFELTVTAGGASASDTVTVTVANVNVKPEFAETVPAQLYWVGAAIDALALPAATGGNGALTYTLSPALPEGLVFDPETRIVSGTPSVAMAETGYTLTATDMDGDEATLAFPITVLEDLFPEFAETVPAQLYWVGAAIDALALPAATGGNGALTYTLSPALPEGTGVRPGDSHRLRHAVGGHGGDRVHADGDGHGTATKRPWPSPSRCWRICSPSSRRRCPPNSTGWGRRSTPWRCRRRPAVTGR